MTVAAPQDVRTPTLPDLVHRAGRLYTLPAAAVEVIRLTDHPKVDVRALKECIEKDPALTAKLLRVVNSSMFGLSREVSDLNQALALLGIKPLKILVLGFSLPENLFAAATLEQLQRYWRTTLARAVAARELSERLFRRPGDESFLAGILQDLGVLAMIAELGPRFGDLLSDAVSRGLELVQLERQALGFDHVQLTAELLDRWNMPQTLVRSIREPRNVAHWARNRADCAHVVRTLHLAELVAQLVAQRRLSVLPDLLEAGEAYCGLTHAQLKDLLATIEPRVEQLAETLAVGSIGNEDYTAILAEAHRRMAKVVDDAGAELCAAFPGRAIARANRVEPVAPSAASVHAAAEEAAALAYVTGLQADFAAHFRRNFARPNSGSTAASQGGGAAVRAASPVGASAVAEPDEPTNDITSQLTLAVGASRSERSSLSVVLFGVRPVEVVDATVTAELDQLLSAAIRAADVTDRFLFAPHRCRRLAILPGKDRLQAVEVARRVVEQLRSMLVRSSEGDELPVCAVGAGVASTTSPAKNFRPQSLIEAAERCLSAALKGGAVKSLEVSY